MMFEEGVGFSRLEKKRGLSVIARIYTLVAVCVGFVMFRATDVGSGFRYIGTMFSFVGGTAGFGTLSPWVIAFTVCGIVFSLPVVPRLREKFGGRHPTAYGAISYAFALVLLVLSVMSLVSSAFNPFIYYIF